MKTYPISTGNNTPVYSNTQFSYKKGTIYATDELYVTSIGSNWAYCTYPISGGRKEGYIRLSAISPNNIAHKVNTSTAQINVYRRSNLSQSYGYVAKGDSVTAVAQSGSATQVIYPIGGGLKKMGWISTSSYNTYINKKTTVNNPPADSAAFDPIWPCKKTYNVTQLYKNSKGEKHSTRFKYGIDIGAPKGEEVVAVESGKVILSEYSKTTGFGNWIMVQHNNGKVSLYAHLNSRKVSKGAQVKKGQTIGYVGNSSARYTSMGAHLHFELGKSNTLGAAGDPWMEYYKPKYGSKIKIRCNTSK